MIIPSSDFTFDAYQQGDYGDHCIIHGDCRDVLPRIPDKAIDLVLTDPPYGINMNTDYFTTREKSQATRPDKRHAWNGKSHPKIFMDDKPFDPSIVSGKSKRLAMFGANNFASKLSDSYSWIVWDKKTEGIPSNSFSDAELVYCCGANFNSVRVFRHMWSGYQRASEHGYHVHPTQKPVLLIQFIIELFDVSNLILDPFLGSGTTLVAAKNLGRRAIGIEINYDYCVISENRLRQEVLAL